MTTMLARADGPVTLEREGRTGFIVIDNPPINAGSLAVREGLIAALPSSRPTQVSTQVC